MEETLWIILIPVIWLLVAKYWLRTSFNYKELGISLAVVFVLTIVTVQLGKYGQTGDHEVWNGEITKKERTHGQYTESYRCRCYTTCSGSGSKRTCSEHCSTCYREHYTVLWQAQSSIGPFRLKYRDSTSRSVYKEKDPSQYVKCKVGDPAAREKDYTNYVQAVPNSLFNDDSKINTYAKQVPAYPKVYNYYRINRVINQAGVDAGTVKLLNDGMGNALRKLGPSKQANINVILTSNPDPSYRYAVERVWLGGKKNDITIFVGTNKDKKIVWVDIMTWALNSGNELFHVTMRDGLMAQGTLDATKFVPFVQATIAKLYDRPQMKDYKYLESEISPPFWVLMMAIILAFASSIGLTFLFHKHEI